MKILVLNCGSSSIKYALYDMDDRSVMAQGGIERVGMEGAFVKVKLPNGEKRTIEHDIPEHTEGVKLIFSLLTDKAIGAIKSLEEIDAVGHRMVHAGEKFAHSVVIDDEVIKAYLMNEKHIPDYQADISAAFAQGIVGKAVKLASSDEFNELKESALSLIKRLDDIDLYELGAAVKQIAEYKLKVQDYFDLIMVWYRDVLYMKATNDVNGLIFKDEVYDIKKQAAKHSYQGIEAILEALEKAKIRINANVNFDLVIELLLMTIKEN